MCTSARAAGPWRATLPPKSLEYLVKQSVTTLCAFHAPQRRTRLTRRRQRKRRLRNAPRETLASFFPPDLYPQRARSLSPPSAFPPSTQPARSTAVPPTPLSAPLVPSSSRTAPEKGDAAAQLLRQAAVALTKLSPLALFPTLLPLPRPSASLTLQARHASTSAARIVFPSASAQPASPVRAAAARETAVTPPSAPLFLPICFCLAFRPPHWRGADAAIVISAPRRPPPRPPAAALPSANGAASLFRRNAPLLCPCVSVCVCVCVCVCAAALFRRRERHVLTQWRSLASLSPSSVALLACLRFGPGLGPARRPLSALGDRSIYHVPPLCAPPPYLVPPLCVCPGRT